MASGVRLTYGTLTLLSTEVIKFSCNRSFKINTMETVSLSEITQPGNLSPITFQVSAIIRDNSTTKFNSWLNKVSEKPLETFTFLSRTWNNTYLTAVDIDSAELDTFGDILRFDMSLNFMVNQNF